MNFTKTPLDGAVLIELDRREDGRGFFARTFCAQEFAEHGVNPLVAQCNASWNARAGTLRGMHYQIAPATEAKLIRCTSGAIYDVIIDLRPESPTYLDHFSAELTAVNHAALYVPEMFAHGYQALTDGAEVTYQVSVPYSPGSERGLRHDDPALRIEWPLPVTAISDKDRAWPLLTIEAAEVGT